MDDYEQIRQLSARYNRTSDAGDADGWVSCWTEDGLLQRSNAPAPVHGHDEFRAAVSTPPVPGQHMTAEYYIEVSGDTATSSCYLMYLDRTAGFKVHFFGIYNDELVRTDEGWKYKRRLLDILEPDGSIAQYQA